MAYPEPHYTIYETAKDLPTYTAESTDKILARQEDGRMGYILVSDLQVTLDGDGLAKDTDLTDGSINAVFNTVRADVNGTGTNFQVGDDAYIGDINVVNTLQVSGVQNATVGYIQFGSGSNMPKIGGNGANRLNLSNIPTYANKAAAIAGGLVTGDVYRTGDNLCIVF
jgi:hypothetical protein